MLLTKWYWNMDILCYGFPHIIIFSIQLKKFGDLPNSTYYSKHVGEEGYGKEKCLEMWETALNKVTPKMWENTVEDTNKIILNWQ